ncbi:MAG: 30S ribosomal protein S6e [Thaumarchaeota archaeon]|nr:30S ribosomal protein S6e [Nitrososphaerota archaeon]
MASFKLVLSDAKTGKSEVQELKDETAQPLLGRKVGEVLDATSLGLTGTIKITGGSDKAGFPMRGDVLGSGKKYVLMSRGIGYKSKEEGSKKRKLVRGGTISEEVYQVNAVRVEAKSAVA